MPLARETVAVTPKDHARAELSEKAILSFFQKNT